MNTNTVKTLQLIRTATKLETDWWQVLRGSASTGAKEDESISPCYGPFSLGGRLETYETCIYLSFQIFSGRGKPRITETADTESVDTWARLYFDNQIKRNDVGGACGRKVREERCMQGFGDGTWHKETTSKAQA
jgi:hypothetical protein